MTPDRSRPDSQHPSPELPLATLRQRLLAHVIDCVVVGVPVVAFTLALLLSDSPSSQAGRLLHYVFGFVGLVMPFVGPAVNDWILVERTGQSVGKAVLHIAVVGPGAKRPDARQAWRRWAAKSAPLVPLLFLIPFWVLWSAGHAHVAGPRSALLVSPLAAWLIVDALSILGHPRRQTLHDRWAQTSVVQVH